MNGHRYLILKSSVFIFIKGNKCLLYNSEDTVKLFISDERTVYFFLNQRIELNNVFEINNLISEKTLKTIVDSQMGHVEQNTLPPFQPSPMPVLNFTDKGGVKDELSPVEKRLNNWASNIFSIEIILNDEVVRQGNADLNETILDNDAVIRFLSNIGNLSKLKSLEFVCHHPIESYELAKLISHFSKEVPRLSIFLRVQYENWLGQKTILSRCFKVLSQLKNLRFRFDINRNCYNDYVEFVKQNKLEKSLCSSVLSVTSEKDLKTNKQYVDDITPVYDFSNHDFFQKFVFLNTHDLQNLTPSKNEIYRNMILNSNYFGRLLINANGDILTRKKGKVLGNIYVEKNIISFIDKKGNKVGDWLLTRGKVKPCSDCLFCYLCPPVSDYEFDFHRFNLCDHE